jgi:hypothetical protein
VSGRALAKRLCDNSVGKAANKLSNRGAGFAIAGLAFLTGSRSNYTASHEKVAHVNALRRI